MKKITICIIALTLLIFASCSNGGDNATLTIDLGKGMPDKASVSIDQLRHVITLSSAMGKQTLSVSGGGTVKTSVAPGFWRIDVEAFFGNELYAVGAATADVQVGQNTNVTVMMNIVWTGEPEAGGGGSSGSGSGISVMIDPPSVTVQYGTWRSFTVDVSGANNPLNVTWSLSGNDNPLTYISPSTGSCTLFVDPAETASIVYVTVASNEDPSAKATATVTLTTDTVIRIKYVTIISTTLSPIEPYVIDIVAGDFASSADASSAVLLEMIPVPGLTISSPIATPTGTPPFERNFRITISLDNTANFPSNQASIPTKVDNSSLPPGYTYDGTTFKLQIPIRDGKAPGREIPVANINVGNFLTYTNTAGKYFILDDDPLYVNTPIGSISNQFAGNFNGNGKTVDLSIAAANGFGEAGFFGYIGSSGVVKNFKVTGSITISGGTGAIYAGAVAGRNYGRIFNVSSKATISAESTNSTSYCGGIAGLNDGSVQNCYTTGSVSAKGYILTLAGGITGDTTMNSNSSVSYCWASGAINSQYGDPGSGANAGGISGFGATDTSLSYCAALNPSITASLYTPGTSNTNTARIVVGSVPQLTGNYSNLSGAWGNIGATDLDGANFSSPGVENNWKTSGSGPYWASIWGGTSETAPWYWDNGNSRPILWFETTLNQ